MVDYCIISRMQERKSRFDEYHEDHEPGSEQGGNQAHYNQRSRSAYDRPQHRYNDHRTGVQQKFRQQKQMRAHEQYAEREDHRK
jgi:hypothetical protein